MTTIPFALLAALVGLWLTGQTVNIMTLGGLALAIGVLVDESTVAVENIHTHLARGEPVGVAVFEATRETITPRLLAMLAILAVFVPSFFLVGASKSLFALSARGGLRHARVLPARHARARALGLAAAPSTYARRRVVLQPRAAASMGICWGAMRLRWAVFGVYLLMAFGHLPDRASSG